MKSDLEIAQAATLLPCEQLAQRLNLAQEDWEPYGRYKAKVDPRLAHRDGPEGSLILVTAITPTPAGEGKTTISTGLADGLSKLEKKTVLCLREPSLGPVFGMKGGAAGGGYAQVVPMEDINLHFTGDLHAITAANNLLAALIDNSIYQGNPLGLDPRRIQWKRCVDMNDRQLRQITSGLGGRVNGMPREDGFDISVASEVMAIFCLAESLSDLKHRLGQIVVGYTYDNQPVTAHQLGAEGAMTALLKDAFRPNLVQTLEGTPAFIHGGPFANIAHGCNSVIATKLGLKLADFVVTEAGFGADLGAEKFLNLKCRTSQLAPKAVVVVATVRALKYQGGCAKEQLGEENLEALLTGCANLGRHLENIQQFGLPVCVAINPFPTDTSAELSCLQDYCTHLGVQSALTPVYTQGGAGATALAELVVKLTQQPSQLTLTYTSQMTLEQKVTAIAQKIYRAGGVQWTKQARQALSQIEAMGYGHLPVCIAKTQYSFTDDPSRLGAPSEFTLTVRQLRLSAGAGFVVVFMGDILTMPGLPKKPAAVQIDVNEEGQITGLF